MLSLSAPSLSQQSKHLNPDKNPADLLKSVNLDNNEEPMI